VHQEEDTQGPVLPLVQEVILELELLQVQEDIQELELLQGLEDTLEDNLGPQVVVIQVPGHQGQDILELVHQVGSQEPQEEDIQELEHLEEATQVQGLPRANMEVLQWLRLIPR